MCHFLLIISLDSGRMTQCNDESRGSRRHFERQNEVLREISIQRDVAGEIHPLNVFRIVIVAIHLAAGLLMIAMSLPLIRRRVPPNSLYGLRVRKTLGDPTI